MDGEISISLVNLNVNNHTLTVLKMLTICLCQCKSALFYKDKKCWAFCFKTFGHLSSVFYVLNAKNKDVFLIFKAAVYSYFSMIRKTMMLLWEVGHYHLGRSPRNYYKTMTLKWNKLISPPVLTPTPHLAAHNHHSATNRRPGHQHCWGERIYTLQGRWWGETCWLGTFEIRSDRWHMEFCVVSLSRESSSLGYLQRVLQPELGWK